MLSGSEPPNTDGHEIREEESYKADMDRLRLSYESMDVAFEEVSMALYRRPDIFPQVPGAADLNLRRVKIIGCSDRPGLSVWFTFDDNLVRLLHIDELGDEE